MDYKILNIQQFDKISDILFLIVLYIYCIIKKFLLNTEKY